MIQTGQRSGKTLKLIQLCAESNGYMVVKDHKEADRIARLAKSKGYVLNYPITYFEFINSQYLGKNCGSLYIDNIELLLEYIAPTVIIAAISSNVSS